MVWRHGWGWHWQGGEKEKERGSLVLEGEDLTINMRWGERGGGGKLTTTTIAEGEMPCGQRFGGKVGRRTTMVTIAGGEVMSSCA